MEIIHVSAVFRISTYYNCASALCTMKASEMSCGSNVTKKLALREVSFNEASFI